MRASRLAALLALAAGTTAQYWWVYPGSDCAKDDVVNVPTHDVGQLKAKCVNTTGCVGFNTNGWLKNSQCETNIAAAPCDLYLLKDTPQPQQVWHPVWPLPAASSNGTTARVVDAVNFKFAVATASDDLAGAVARYALTTFPHMATSTSQPTAITSLTITVSDTTAPLQLGADESYVLDIPASGSAATLQAATVYGAYHGLETFSQLVRFDFDSETYVLPGAPWHIADRPRFSHRGVLVDSCRHFEPVETLKRFIDSMTYAKLNVMHWHIVDSQSFPFDSPTYPLLGSKGAYSMPERYTTNDVKEVVEYARQRGVRVMVEIDTPGHAESWCKGYPEVCPSPSCLSPLNVANNATFDLIAGLYKDLVALFPDQMFHLGGDEVNTNCWSQTPAIAQWLKDRSLTPDGGYEYFVDRVQTITRALNRDTVNWEEVWNHFGTKLDKRSIIHQWLSGSPVGPQVVNAGYRLIVSTSSQWYLDHLAVTWQVMYNFEPCSNISDTLCAQYVLGGEGCMWGETVDTSDLQNTVWPRMAAIAERLWSRKQDTPTADVAHQRYSAFRCLLNRRGVAAAPSNNPTARTAPGGPGGCYAQ